MQLYEYCVRIRETVKSEGFLKAMHYFNYLIQIMGNHTNTSKLSSAGLLITLGIIFGDIGTSPLYTMKAIIGTQVVSEELIYGAVSCVLWTLTLQTTIKYVWLTLNADNNGEGGIFSLYALMMRKMKFRKLIIIAMIGGAMLLADGIITPAISVISAIEGVERYVPHLPIVGITIGIIFALFAFQQFGTHAVGKLFGPIMGLWFLSLAVFGVVGIMAHPAILQAFSPHHAINLIFNTPGGFWLMGGVFLCTTGAEALYSDLGHCGKSNIRVSWIFVKITLLLNYFGQGAWCLGVVGVGHTLPDVPFFALTDMLGPWGGYWGVTIATAATIIASQALISGSFTLVSEAIRLNLFPKITVNYPSESKGQLYIPMVNWILCFGCIGMVLIFQSSTAMEAAYGLAITVTMLMTTVLLIYYLLLKHVAIGWRILLLAVYLPIEGAFLVANLEKFPHGGYVTLIVAMFIIGVMFIFKLAHEIKARLSTTVKLSDYLPLLKKLSLDTNEVKYATHLVYLTSARSDNEVERNVLLSILQNQPKRADYYWFVHVEVADEPYTMSCKVKKLEADDVIRVKFKLGFRVQQKIGMFMRIITEKMLLTGDIRGINHEYHLIEHDHAGDFRFVIVEEVVSYNNPLSFFEKNIMQAYTTIKSWTGNPKKWFGLDHSLVDVEKIPVVFAATDLKMPLEIKVCSISPEEGEKTI